MKLQKRLSRKYKNKEYHKYVIVIPEAEVINAKLKEGDELQISSNDGELRIRKL